MIISALCQYYNQLLEDSESGIAKLGWCSRQVKHLLMLSPEGELLSVASCGEDGRGTEMIVPQQAGRPGTGKNPYFLCDKPKYLLGIEIDSERTCLMAEHYEASKTLHQLRLANCNGAVAEAVKCYFDRWNPSIGALEGTPGLSDGSVGKDDLLAFCVDCGSDFERAHENAEILASVNAQGCDGDCGADSISLVTGERCHAMRLHPGIKGIRKGNAKLVSFDKGSTAFDSYGCKEGRNAPMDDVNVHAYTTALSFLLNHDEHSSSIGNTAVVFWSEAKASDEQESSVLSYLLSDESRVSSDESEIQSIVKKLSRGEWCDVEGLSKIDQFCILGIEAPNDGRLAVRFFLRGEFGKMIACALDHYRISDVCHRSTDSAYVSPNHLLRSLERSEESKGSKGSKRSKRGEADPIVSRLSASFMSSILQGGRYPEALYQNVLLRIRATKEDADKKQEKVKREHAAIIRSYLIRNRGMSEQEFTVSLNISNKSQAYLLGRAFYILEYIQETANDKATITNSYLNSASATPATVFPQLLRLSNAHLAKIRRREESERMATYLQKQLGDVLDSLGDQFPKRLSLEDQGSFFLGYYQQKQERFRKKNSKKEGRPEEE